MLLRFEEADYRFFNSSIFETFEYRGNENGGFYKFYYFLKLTYNSCNNFLPFFLSKNDARFFDSSIRSFFRFFNSSIFQIFEYRINENNEVFTNLIILQS